MTTTRISYEEAQKIFKKYDKNKNGAMDIKEFKPAFMELISPNLAKHEIQQGFDICDRNKDGVVTFNEFWRYCNDYNNKR